MHTPGRTFWAFWAQRFLLRRPLRAHAGPRVLRAERTLGRQRTVTRTSELYAQLYIYIIYILYIYICGRLASSAPPMGRLAHWEYGLQGAECRLAQQF